MSYNLTKSHKISYIFGAFFGALWGSVWYHIDVGTTPHVFHIVSSEMDGESLSSKLRCLGFFLCLNILFYLQPGILDRFALPVHIYVHRGLIIRMSEKMLHRLDRNSCPEE